MRTDVKQFLKFVAVGLINTIIGLSVIYGAMFYAGAGPFAANAIGYGVGFIIGYHLNRKWTFSNRRRAESALFYYIAVVAVSYCANISIVYVGIFLLELNAYLVQFAGVVSYTVLVYVGSRRFVFRLA